VARGGRRWGAATYTAVHYKSGWITSRSYSALTSDPAALTMVTVRAAGDPVHGQPTVRAAQSLAALTVKWP
jgi:hypothetical protein